MAEYSLAGFTLPRSLSVPYEFGETMDLILDARVESEEDYLYVFFLTQGIESFRISMGLQSGGVKFYKKSKRVWTT